jgi:hypothetical protein
MNFRLFKTLTSLIILLYDCYDIEPDNIIIKDYRILYEEIRITNDITQIKITENNHYNIIGSINYTINHNSRYVQILNITGTNIKLEKALIQYIKNIAFSYEYLMKN